MFGFLLKISFLASVYSMSSSAGVGSSLKVVISSSSSSTDGNTRANLGLREQGFTEEASIFCLL